MQFEEQSEHKREQTRGTKGQQEAEVEPQLPGGELLTELNEEFVEKD